MEICIGEEYWRRMYWRLALEREIVLEREIIWKRERVLQTGIGENCAISNLLEVALL